MTFGERLKKSRREKGLTQAQLAEMVGVASATMAGYENGNRQPDVHKIKKITEALGIDAGYLLGIQEKLAAQEGSELDKELRELFEKADDRGKEEILRIARYVLSEQDK